MKVKLIKSLIGSPVHRAGETIDVSNEQGVRFIEAGIAIPVEQPKRTAKKKLDNVEKRGVQRNK